MRIIVPLGLLVGCAFNVAALLARPAGCEVAGLKIASAILLGGCP